MTKLDELLKLLDQIQGLPAAALVCFTCIVVGYVLRFIKRFPNDGIPVVVILWGALAMLVLADPRATSMSPRIWTGRNLAVGLIIGMIAWLLHKLVLSRLEDWIAARFPGSSDTAFFNKREVDFIEPADKPAENHETQNQLPDPGGAAPGGGVH